VRSGHCSANDDPQFTSFVVTDTLQSEGTFRWCLETPVERRYYVFNPEQRAHRTVHTIASQIARIGKEHATMGVDEDD
jgi:hypothetical protein